ncbi:MAG: hypothetical protein H6985_02600 [Pseudomonadales bacterium]|nr:hypothetical protein [Pseudomonadales bacterium]
MVANNVKIARVLGLGLLTVLFSASIQAAVVVEDLGAGITRVTVDPITFNVTADGSAGFLVIKDFWAAPSSACGQPDSSTMSWSINGAAAVTPTQYGCTGQINFAFGSIGLTDLFFDFNGGAGDLVNGLTGDEIVIGGVFTFSNSVSIAANPGPYTATLQSASNVIATASTAVAAPPPSPSATPVPTMPAYGLVLTMLGLFLVAGRRLRQLMITV